MRRYELEDIVKAMDAMRDEIKLGNQPDAYDMQKWLDEMASEIEYADEKLGEKIEDAEDEARNAMTYQEIYLETLQHAENHIAWLEEEFSEEIVECDRYQRQC